MFCSSFLHLYLILLRASAIIVRQHVDKHAIWFGRVFYRHLQHTYIIHIIFDTRAVFNHISSQYLFQFQT